MHCPESKFHKNFAPTFIDKEFFNESWGNVKVILKNIPVYKCLDCQKQGIDSFIIDKYDPNKIIKNVLTSMIRNLKRNILKTSRNIDITLNFAPANIQESFYIKEPRYSLNDLIFPEEFRLNITNLINSLKIYFTSGLPVSSKSQSICVNFFGRSGTGKTACVEAIANVLNKKLLVVNYAELESKYVGETPKNILKVFKKAKENNAIILFDEADSFLSTRLTELRQATDYSVNLTRSVLLKQLDEYSGVVFFCTNLLSNYDKAFLRRILFFYEFPIPSNDEKNKIWRSKIPPDMLGAEDIDFNVLRNCSDLTGADIEKIALQVYLLSYSQEEKKSYVSLKLVQNLIDDLNKVKAIVEESKISKPIIIPKEDLGNKLFTNKTKEKNESA
ncbi:ATP-binding protein [Lutibacter sp.]